MWSVFIFLSSAPLLSCFYYFIFLQPLVLSEEGKNNFGAPPGGEGAQLSNGEKKAGAVAGSGAAKDLEEKGANLIATGRASFSLPLVEPLKLFVLVLLVLLGLRAPRPCQPQSCALSKKDS